MFTPEFLAKHKEAGDSFDFNIINSALTPLDKAYMVINYPRPAPHPDAPEWTLAFALDVAGVDSRTTKRILDLHKQDKINDLRTTFNMWNALMQSDRPSNSLPGVEAAKSTLQRYAEIASNILAGQSKAK